MKGDVDGAVRVASIYSIGFRKWAACRRSSRRGIPKRRLHVDYMRPDKVYEAVRDDTADLGLVSYPESSREIAAIPWRDEEMQVAVPPSHPLAEREELFPSDLDGQNFIGFDEDLSIRRELDRFFRTQGIEVQLVMQFDNIQMIKEAVALGRASAFCRRARCRRRSSRAGWSRCRCTRRGWCGRSESCTASGRS